MRINFKNVGQGDTIILEWKKKKKCFVGIIDCKKCNSRNPAIEHLQELLNDEINFEIDFIFLSHPHFDHFSGMLDLLNYCHDNKLKINRYGHSMFLHKTYLDWANINENHTALLADIVDRVVELKRQGTITGIEYLSYNWGMDVGDKFRLYCMGPSDDEFRAFTQRAGLFGNNNEQLASKAANLLSTVLLLTIDNSCVIFSSDVTLEAQDRIFNNCPMIREKRFVLGQVPHHGSKDNHNIQNWKGLTYSQNCPVVISAGKHERYLHPHITVLEDFHNSKFKIHSTNKVNGVNGFLKKLKKASILLDMISEPIEEYHFNGDQIFEFNRGKLIYQPLIN